MVLGVRSIVLTHGGQICNHCKRHFYQVAKFSERGLGGQNCYWCKWRQPVGELAINEIYNSVDAILLRMSPEWKRWSSTRTILKTKEESETYMNTYITYNTYIYTITNMLETSGSTVHGNIALLKLVSKPDNTEYRSACLPKLVIQSCNPFLPEFKISPDFI